jgi:hypothetical protein
MKVCNICSEAKPLDKFYRSVTHTDGYQSRCCDCQNRRRYGDNFRGGHMDMPESEFFFRWIGQKGECGSCFQKLTVEGTHIDHDHACCGKGKSCTKCRRSLLCRACNVSLGILHEDADKIDKLAKYARRIQGDR